MIKEKIYDKIIWSKEGYTAMDNDKNGMIFQKTAVARKEEIVLLEKMLSHNKVCIINGMAGIGKTYFAKMYSYLHENVVYISDYYFQNCGSKNHVIEHSFAKNIKSNSLLIIDDIVEDINLYINSVFFDALQKLNPKNIVLLTRQNVFQSGIPILTIQPFTLMQTYELIEKTIGNKYSHAEMEQIARLSNGNPVLIRVICSLLNSYSNIDEIWEQLSLEENKRLIYPFIQKVCSIPKLNDSEIQTYVEILMFGKIEKCLLKRWDVRLNEEIEKDIASLIAKGVISYDGKSLYGDYLAGDILDDYPLCYDYCVSIVNNMRDDILNGIRVDDKYAIAIISTLKEHYEFIDFIVVFYEQKIEFQRKADFTNTLTQILQSLGRIEGSMEKNVIPQVAKIEKIDENVEKLVIIQNEIQSIINQLFIGLKDNEKALKVLEELSDIVKNPKKSKLDRMNSCIGFLGSVATLTTFSVNDFTTNANALISQLEVLINMLPFMGH